ncbi:MAG: ECF transporter S component [Candidatus Bathyarchaeota archaeon]|nr:ECF transporter S component [Candidatus Bathyarchaeota archaeon]MDH5494451.1 ECF transporter S component [Candidatus Bathyarchaeota archaeon]
MKINTLALSTKNITLTVVFASFYTVFSSWNLFPLVGGQGSFIQAGVVMAPLVGIILGPWLGIFSIAIGGAIGALMSQTGPFGLFSFVPHVAAALCAGLLCNNKRWFCSVLYLILLLVFAFYPVVGPAWLWPPFLWLHVAGLVFVFSPLQSRVDEFLRENGDAFKLAFGVGITVFIATLFGHVVGSLMFEVFYWPSFISEVSAWKADWQLIMWLYPVERLLIAVVSTFIGAGLLKALRIYGFKIGG